MFTVDQTSWVPEYQKIQAIRRTFISGNNDIDLMTSIMKHHNWDNKCIKNTLDINYW